MRLATHCGMALLVHYATIFYLAVVTVLFIEYYGIVAGNFVALQTNCAVVIAGDDEVRTCMLSLSSSLAMAYLGEGTCV